MNWSSWSQFAAMGGYGLFVWGSFGMCVVVLVGEVALLEVRRRALRHEVDDGAVDVREPGL
ncbi:MAG: heme exporter protein CcmD [Rhodoferax sp.]|nr:heme exporter protein CcmD [Rhodoferax sp.]